jgi:hypothetical protein
MEALLCVHMLAYRESIRRTRTQPIGRHVDRLLRCADLRHISAKDEQRIYPSMGIIEASHVSEHEA